MKALTAWTLRDGVVVYWTKAGNWSSAITDALLMEDDDLAAQALAAAKKQETAVIGAYLIAMEGQGTPAAREAMRENIRARGPSVRADLGKQAERR
ncbi:MAG: DUF2849 domain-containing protein [Hyphomonadaceae bacterium]